MVKSIIRDILLNDSQKDTLVNVFHKHIEAMGNLFTGSDEWHPNVNEFIYMMIDVDNSEALLELAKKIIDDKERSHLLDFTSTLIHAIGIVDIKGISYSKLSKLGDIMDNYKEVVRLIIYGNDYKFYMEASST